MNLSRETRTHEQIKAYCRRNPQETIHLYLGPDNLIYSTYNERLEGDQLPEGYTYLANIHVEQKFNDIEFTGKDQKY